MQFLSIHVLVILIFLVELADKLHSFLGQEKPKENLIKH